MQDVMQGIIVEYLSPMEKGILHAVLHKYGIENIRAFIRFWDGTKIQIDGELSPTEIRALATFMEMMEALEITKQIFDPTLDETITIRSPTTPKEEVDPCNPTSPSEPSSDSQ